MGIYECLPIHAGNFFDLVLYKPYACSISHCHVWKLYFPATSTPSNSYISLVISESWWERVWYRCSMYNRTFNILFTSTSWLFVRLYINCHLLQRVIFIITVERSLIYGQKYKNFGVAYFYVHLVQYYYIVLWNKRISVLRSIVFKASFYVSI